MTTATHFSNIEYRRPDMAAFSAAFKKALRAFETAENMTELHSSMMNINDLRNEFDSMYSICHVRHTVNTNDDFYEKENAFYDQNLPDYEDLLNQYNRALAKSPYKKEIAEKWGQHLLNIADLSTGTFKPEILEDLKVENQLRSQHSKLKANAKIMLRGEAYNLSSIFPKETGSDRELRKEASLAKWDFFAKNQEELEGIYDKLVKSRHSMAKKLGYDNFVKLGYTRMLRSDYGPEEVANYRKQIQEFIVPIATKIRARQQKRLGLDKLYFYDENFHFLSGNPTPVGNPKSIVQSAGKMYDELSPETSAFFKQMLDRGLMDLEAKPGKAPGGYCTYIGSEKVPYIFANFNGTSGDVDVLTHEAGHAFQVHSSRELGIVDYNWPTYEACEIHSMSMEFFTHPWMKLFFEKDTDKYHYNHVCGALLFLPYGAAVDEFQHFVYENPDCGPAARNQFWASLEEKYLPGRDYAGNSFLEQGGFWMKQGHIFDAPFYYIDYTLAQICALQFWKKDREDHTSAWNDYLTLCQAGGSKPFLKLVELAKLRSPFEDGCVESVVGFMEKWLDGIDDSAF